MNGGKLLKFLISCLIIIQVFGFVFKITFLITYSGLVISVVITAFYFVSTKRIEMLHIIVLLIFLIGQFFILQNTERAIRFQMILSIIVYVLIFNFLYYNHKSFTYNSRDVFTLVLGSSLYTVIFFLTYFSLKTQMGDLQLLGFFHLLLLYVLVVVGAMHYINIRSEKSLWFFLSMLNFAFNDYIVLIDRFYLQSDELKIITLICKPMALIFLVNYMVAKSLDLKSEEFEGF